MHPQRNLHSKMILISLEVNIIKAIRKKRILAKQSKGSSIVQIRLLDKRIEFLYHQWKLFR